MKYGLIAGNGRFPILALEAARQLGHEVVVVAIQEEAWTEVEHAAARCHWVSLGQLGKLIEVLKAEGIQEVVLAGQVKHVQIFSGIRPDWRLIKMLAGLKEKNTAALIGGVVRALEEEGILVVDSTTFLKPLVAEEGVLSRRKPTREELADIEY